MESFDFEIVRRGCAVPELEGFKLGADEEASKLRGDTVPVVSP